MVVDTPHICLATLADLLTVRTLSIQTFEDAFGAQNTPTNMAAYVAQAFSEAQLRAELADPHCTFLLAWVGGEPVGYAKLREGRTPTEVLPQRALEIQRIYVLRAAQGQKVGAYLMRTCLAQARARAYEAVWLGVWEHNALGRAFYRRWDFTPFGSYIFQFGDDPQTDLLLWRPV